MARNNYEPSLKDVINMPVETQVAVLYERVGTMRDEIRGLRRAIYSFVGTVGAGAVLFLFSLAAGWIGPHGAAHSAVKAIWGVIG